VTLGEVAPFHRSHRETVSECYRQLGDGEQGLGKFHISIVCTSSGSSQELRVPAERTNQMGTNKQGGECAHTRSLGLGKATAINI
jgi:hypothetical protein